MGNICRSPTAESVFRKLVTDAGRAEEFEIDSAGTIGYHSGQRADPRMRAAAQDRGYQIDSIARRVEPADLQHFDYVVAMDDDNYRDLNSMGAGSVSRLVRMVEFCRVHDVDEVPDPYYGGEDGFHVVIDILEDACANLLREI